MGHDSLVHNNLFYISGSHNVGHDPLVYNVVSYISGSHAVGQDTLVNTDFNIFQGHMQWNTTL